MKNLLLSFVMLLLTVIASPLQATTLSGYLTVDDYFSLYISQSESTLGTLVCSGTEWEDEYYFSYDLKPGITYYLHIVAGEEGAFMGGFVGSFNLSDNNFYFPNGEQELLSDIGTNWIVYLDQFGGTQGEIQYADAYGINPRNGGNWRELPNVADDAYWIWTNHGSDLSVIRYFSAKITPVCNFKFQPQAPVTENGKALFIPGSTIPLQFKLTDSSGNPITGLAPTLSLARISKKVSGWEFKRGTLSKPDSGNTFREIAPGTYLYNLRTCGYLPGTWKVTVNTGLCGVLNVLQFSLL